MDTPILVGSVNLPFAFAIELERTKDWREYVTSVAFDQSGQLWGLVVRATELPDRRQEKIEPIHKVTWTDWRLVRWQRMSPMTFQDAPVIDAVGTVPGSAPAAEFDHA
jgi:hypothetical protein